MVVVRSLGLHVVIEVGEVVVGCRTVVVIVQESLVEDIAEGIAAAVVVGVDFLAVYCVRS